jgi:glycosyltransferase involved in cell wall biosynthesis
MFRVARNLALRTAKGELLAFIDDDCRMSKEYVSQLLHHDANDGGRACFAWRRRVEP